ncbi:ribokinase [Antricoccus suffuscus]|uniref:Ribokinase n=1 Tax=Antricoccus suffuscus TaxID=1629062 RepID=A0A2T1A2N0_9ACTN|nr:ribokinase [Antricoccus suffuscus]PRZ42747.1 ribokinase [Antricoccus suffuscus]
MSVVVLGSANLDVVIALQRIPSPGETVLTDTISRGCGGKGANQAVAVARSGAPTTFLGAVGNDDAGRMLLDGLAGAGADVSAVRRTDGSSGTAYVMVDAQGENAIVVIGGANAGYTDLTEAEADIIRRADVLLMQFEVPIETVTAAASIARAAGVQVMLNAAPYAELPADLLENLDLLIVNEHEAALSAGTQGTPEEVATVILGSVPGVLITLGAAGSLLATRGTEPVRINAPHVTAVDTTGAGDTFSGAYAAATVEGLPAVERLRFASAAAALAVQERGAVDAIPDRARIDEALRHYYPG